MKKVILMITVIFLLISLISCSSGLKQNYKEIKWNSTIEQIKKIETQELVTNDDKIYFAFYDVYGAQARIEYKFYDNTINGIYVEFLDPKVGLFDSLVEAIKNEYKITWESIDETTAMFETETTDIFLMKYSEYIDLSFSLLED